MKFTYLAILIIGVTGMLVFDYHQKLVFFKNPKAAAKSILIMTSLLLVVDIIGINWSIFKTNPAYVIGINFGTENLPLEEFIFLFLLCYFVLNTNQLLTKVLKNV